MPTGDLGSSSHTNGVVVSLYDIYQLMLMLQNKQSEMDGKMGAFVASSTSSNEIFSRELKRINDEHRDDQLDHEKRIRDLEKRPVISPKAIWAAIGVLIPATGLIVAIISLVTRP